VCRGDVKGVFRVVRIDIGEMEIVAGERRKPERGRRKTAVDVLKGLLW
jgi:hypothetical protein